MKTACVCVRVCVRVCVCMCVCACVCVCVCSTRHMHMRESEGLRDEDKEHLSTINLPLLNRLLCRRSCVCHLGGNIRRERRPACPAPIPPESEFFRLQRSPRAEQGGISQGGVESRPSYVGTALATESWQE